MKTKNNTQKTAFAAIAATGLIIFSLTVNAQFSKNSLFFDSGKNNYTMAMNTTDLNSGRTMTRTNDFSNANTFAAYLVEETEEPLKLEDWMTADFGSSMMDLIEAETESPLEIESWMLDENNFNGSGIDKAVDEPKESNKTISSSKYIFSETNYESALKFEDWMINPNVWK